MNTKFLKYLISIGLLVLFYSCSKDNVEPTPSIDAEGLTKIEDVLNGDDQSLIDLLNKVRGSVGKRGPASKTIWSRNNDYGLGLYISANHVYGLNTWSSRNAELFDLHSENLGIFENSQIPPVDGSVALGNSLIADFPLIHFDISTSATNTSILPAEDFYLGIMDNQRVEKSLFAQYPDLVKTNTPLRMYDPFNRTETGQTWNTPILGKNVISVGYPQDVENFPNGAVVFGKVLSDEESAIAIDELQAAGDTEGEIPYDATVEFLVKATAIPGMSGGGVFNSDGQLLGIMVRSSDTENAPKIIRVVRITYIKSKLMDFYNGLSQTDKNKLSPFVRGELKNN